MRHDLYESLVYAVLGTNTRDFARLYVIDYLDRRARYNVFDGFHGKDRQGLEMWSSELTAFLRKCQQQLLEMAGFRSVDFYGTFSFDACDEVTSDSVITVAHA